MKFINIGHENSVNVDRIVSINKAGAKPVSRLIKRARDSDMLVDSTEGNKTNSVIVTDSGYVILSYHKADTLRKRIHSV